MHQMNHFTIGKKWVEININHVKSITTIVYISVVTLPQLKSTDFIRVSVN